tara:strand:- start:2818 stop:3714 length:897 start_codon:yes stop_codon:yes gene_type:complete
MELKRQIDAILKQIGLTDSEGGLIGLSVGDAALKIKGLISSNQQYADELGLGAIGGGAWDVTINDYISDIILAQSEGKSFLPPGPPETPNLTFDELLEGAVGPKQSIAEYGTTEAGRSGIFDADLSRKLGPTPTPFLRAAGQRLFDPIQAGYTLSSGLGQLPGQMFGDNLKEWLPSSSTDAAGPNFSQYLGMPGVMPSQQQLQSQLRQAGSLFGDRAGLPSLGNAQQGFLTDLSDNMGKQFNLALSSVLQSVPLHLRSPFTKWAQGQFRDARATNPGEQWLPGFIERGFKFGPQTLTQ